MKNLKEIYDEYCGGLKIDRKFEADTCQWLQSFYTRNPDHVGFFTSPYFGLHIPKWTNKDDDHWLIDVLDIDEDEIASYVHKLPTINKDHAVSSNILSISLMYLMYRAQNSKYLSPKDKDLLKVKLMEILCTRYITSIMNNYFNKGPTTKAIAQETFDRLTRRFHLKEAGSWAKMIELKSESFALGETTRAASKYGRQEVFDTFKDELVVRKLNAIKTALNQTIREINQVFREVLEDGSKIKSTSALANGSDGLYIQDLVRSNDKFQSNQNSIFIDKRTFIKPELMDVIESSMDAISPNIFRGALEWILDNQNERRWSKKIEDLRKSILIYGLDLIREENISSTDLVQITYRLRQNFMSGRSNDPTLVRCRKITDEMIVAYRPKSKGKVITLERTAIMMYIVVRSIMVN